MIDGLRLTFKGKELRRLLDEKIAGHKRCAKRWRSELARTPEQQTEEEPLLPDEMCENEAERHDWHVEFLEFIRDRVEPAETYRLGETDMLFAELLPQKPGSLEFEEWEERNGTRFQLERLVKGLGAHD